ncbi:acyl-ACP--UDP-N-acetylglucosamine O-acyltransferase [Pontivivens insulae]|uniref:Acyl-[acyl-carrier-protein]--UDP-N-acetylglucosamine O-acyltransferase n=1 Tax=Pontivivens insulae TaxID=1639689 RepID=A0A2R8AB62_9RHOB|nr:acyl-ACP--UDP-N-acetylglucosamine O-acyltransferase [Pontivivens insulae]RED13216.1 acyl-[acyl-carrier-protein]--UDP-N-acetylglucosamine O-acyltransferase [Pontivivens insulae]SPF29308.1 Acyl-[acyl-carrier-protein]--UDP-N-acetylglucosamine O-acyltransferase [Pontivivens insulae]
MTVHETAIIHPTAIIADGAEIGAKTVVGPYCIIGAEVRLGAEMTLHSHVVVAGDTMIGDGTRIWPFASVGHQPQDLKFNGEKTRLTIGARNMIRESTSINPGTEGGGGLTQIGDGNLFMLGSHVGHDCIIGDNNVFANNAAIAGHCVIADNVIVGGQSGVHQFVHIGRGAMIGAVSMVTKDVIPYGNITGNRGQLSGLNVTGLKRRGVPREKMHALRAAYQAIFADGTGTLQDRARRAAEDHPENELVAEIVAFVLKEHQRSLATP